jgi:hypothetical protein
MARNYSSHDKRRREHDRKKKQQEKLKKRQERNKAKKDAKEAALRGDPVPTSPAQPTAAAGPQSGEPT